MNEKVLEMAGVIKGHIKSGENGTVVADKDVFEKTLPEGLDMKTVSDVQSHQRDFTAASAHAFGEMAVAMMKDDKALEDVTVDFSAGRNTISHALQRSRTTPNPAKKGETITKYGALTTKVAVDGGSASKGALKKVRAHLNELAEKEFC